VIRPVVALALLLSLAACGVYGPPSRERPEPPQPGSASLPRCDEHGLQHEHAAETGASTPTDGATP
jgi:predicted small lipoprotein YifL